MNHVFFHLELQSGSSCQLPDGKPMAFTSTLGYFASKDLNFVTKVLLGLIVCKRYRIIDKT